MPVIAPTLPTIGQFNTTEDPDIVAAFTAILGLVNGGLDDSNVIADAGLDGAKLKDASLAKAKLTTDVLNAFLKLVVPGDHKVSFGTGTATFTATNLLTATLNHGFTPATPTIIIPGILGASVNVACTGTNADATNLAIRVQGVNGVVLHSGDTAQVCWLAIA
jgi:hypothetical protein